jgi:hydroxymethylbilane synthase
MLEIVKQLNHEPTWQSIVAERAFLEAMGGGCSAAVACLGTVTGNTLTLRGMGVGPDGNIYASEKGSVHAPVEIAASVALKLLAMGALRTDMEIKEI